MSVILRTQAPVDLFNSGVEGAPSITATGVEVDDGLVEKITEAGTKQGVVVLVGAPPAPVGPGVTEDLVGALTPEQSHDDTLAPVETDGTLPPPPPAA